MFCQCLLLSWSWTGASVSYWLPSSTTARMVFCQNMPETLFFSPDNLGGGGGKLVNVCGAGLGQLGKQKGNLVSDLVSTAASGYVRYLNVCLSGSAVS